MIRHCEDADFKTICEIINNAAQAYKGVIPVDCWKEPYMSEKELRREIEEGVQFLGFEEDGKLAGVMGIQHVEDVTLIRHAYVRTARRNQGIGDRLLSHLTADAARPVLIGTWADATWAVQFYEKRGFRLVPTAEKDWLLERYWSVPRRQMDTSVVLADERWFERGRPSSQTPRAGESL